MRSRLTPALILSLALPLCASAQMDVAEPFKVGTFEIAGAPTVGVVLRDRYIVDLGRANAAL
jgi:hypothetical protein